jgi:hypothetical protein
LPLCFAGNKQIAALVVWARDIPHFGQLELDDQVLLIKSAWNELLLFAIAWRSMEVSIVCLFYSLSKF